MKVLHATKSWGTAHVAQPFANFLTSLGYEVVHDWSAKWRASLLDEVAFGFGWTWRADVNYHLRLRGKRYLALDAGYLRRLDIFSHAEYFRTSINGLNWTPQLPCDGGRFDALNLPCLPSLLPSAEDEPRTVLFLGQTEGDVSHKMTGDAYVTWCLLVAQLIRRVYPGVVLRFRPHPYATGTPWVVRAVEVLATAGVAYDVPDGRKFEDVLSDGVHAVVTHSSTAAVEALRRGLPVTCHPSAVVAPVSNVVDDLSLNLPPASGDWGLFRAATQHARAKFLRRLAYAQWRIDELADGTAWKFLSPYLTQ
jgi:hypothetical protein